jgi:hypothetical protein
MSAATPTVRDFTSTIDFIDYIKSHPDGPHATLLCDGFDHWLRACAAIYSTGATFTASTMECTITA